MFTWLGTKLLSALSAYVTNVVSALMTAIAPLALSVMTVWVLLYGWAVLRHEVPEPIPTFVWKVTKIGFVLAFALQSGFYITNVSDAANALATGVASTFLPAGAPASTISSPYQLLDQFNDNASKQVDDIMKEAGITRLDLVLAGVVFSIGSVGFLCIAVFVVTLATVFMNFVVAIGPIFVLCLAWRPTQRFFDSWLSMLLNAVVLTWFAFFALGLSTFLGQEMFSAIQDAGGFLGSTLNALSESLRYCVLMLVMAIICFQAPSLAAALTGGAAMHQGVQMIQNVLMVAGLRAHTTAMERGAAASAFGGAITGGAGLPPFAAGQALSRGAAAVLRTPAYRRAAQRGTS